MAVGVSIVCFWCLFSSVAGGEPLTIPEIQYTESADGASPYNGSVVDCVGGVVVFIREAGRPRLVLQDPNALDGWGGIQVKGWASDAFADVNVGDWVELEQTFVEEARGMTFLQYWDENPDGSRPILRVIGSGHRLPRPLHVDVNDIRAPQYEPLEDVWTVADYSAERWESMVVQVRDVDVVEQGLGKALDNYELQSFHEPNDPNARCWGADYFNRDLQKPDLYMPAIEVGRRFRAVTGVLEHYANLGDGYDYYQLLTLSGESVVELNQADLDQDGDVDLWDYRLFTEQLLMPSSPSEEEPCAAADLNCDGAVDSADLDLFNAAWQAADVNGDGIVDGDDLD
jgi:hypothetical protein